MNPSFFSFFIYFNPRFPRGKRLGHLTEIQQVNVISIHASRGGSDVAHTPDLIIYFTFQSTLPAGEATTLLAAEMENRR